VSSILTGINRRYKNGLNTIPSWRFKFWNACSSRYRYGIVFWQHLAWRGLNSKLLHAITKLLDAPFGAVWEESLKGD